MARTHSSYTASPTRSRSPRRSPARRPSKDGSEYEMDLDALGLNSTFESTELQGSYEPPVDRVDTSDIEGPEDFTMNMTYWMTADLPLAQIKSRKEAKGRVEEVRLDAMPEENAAQETTDEGDGVVVEEDSRDHRQGKSTTASPTKRANVTTDERTYSTPASERSMENEEKVRSFLSALPDTDMEGAIAGTPLHMPRQSFLQVPRPSPPKALSLQPTVEDYDTPRKPTQETVIHHMSPAVNRTEDDSLRERIAGLQSRLQQQKLASRTRITELETILSYTQSELEGVRTDNYKQTDKVVSLEKSMEQERQEASRALLAAEECLKAGEQTLDAKMHEFGEEIRLQNLAKLDNQRREFEQQLEVLSASKRLADQQADSKAQSLARVQAEMEDLRCSSEQRLQKHMVQAEEDQQKSGATLSKERDILFEQLASVQARADSLQAQLEKATSEARASREEAESKEATRNAAEAEDRARTVRISELETNLQATRFELECAQADVAAKQQVFRTNLDLNSRIRVLQQDLQLLRADSSASSQQEAKTTELENRISALQSLLEIARADLSTKDRELARHIGSQAQLEHRLNTAQGRIDGLDGTVTTLRQQLAEAHRESSRLRANVGRCEHDIEDANDRLQDARSEADRRVADVEQKLSKMKESKVDTERKFKELQSQRDDLVEGHEAMMLDVRDKAEDAVRKAGALLEQERNEKKRIIKDLKRTKDDLEKLRADAARTVEEEEESDDSLTSISSTDVKEKDGEIASFREIIRKQVVEMKTLKSETNTLRKDNKKLKSAAEAKYDFEATIASLKGELDTLRKENAALHSNRDDQEAINTAMDEKLASMLSKLMKDKAKTVVGKRDGQWQESVGTVQSEKELLGRVLLRQWGREELGIADEKHGERQTYQYQYVKRERAQG
ncbi:hypothetical protein EK21DRAFT_80283 [Setomelanomma holmii]|uniref:Uncharacterized protein n=1 Tax=Setomelanomma holmii TaxID=210430 RepID=A0A9P4GYA5_9PLEO|nr:hypothetical protein EK21DRAFT_80283 [Setomelanomma holmii]